MSLNSFSLIIASNNNHKVNEIRELAPKGFNFQSLNDINFTHELLETTGTIQGNALQKARQVYEFTNLNCVADDSGLVVEELNGDPGVDSAVYAGLPRNDEANVRKLLLNLANFKNRKAYFITILALVLEGKEYLFEGRINGDISNLQRGNSGFGYDPIFIPEGSNLTFAEMSSSQKSSMSHRSIAVRKLTEFLLEYHKN